MVSQSLFITKASPIVVRVKEIILSFKCVFYTEGERRCHFHGPPNIFVVSFFIPLLYDNQMTGSSPTTVVDKRCLFKHLSRRFTVVLDYGSKLQYSSSALLHDFRLPLLVLTLLLLTLQAKKSLHLIQVEYDQ